MFVLDMAVPVMFSPPFEIIRIHTYIRYLCLLAYTDVQHILFVFILPVSLGCPFLIGPSVFSNVYLKGDVNTHVFF